MGVSPLSLAAARFCPGHACALGRASSGPPTLRPAAVPHHRCAGADAVWGRYLVACRVSRCDVAVLSICVPHVAMQGTSTLVGGRRATRGARRQPGPPSAAPLNPVERSYGQSDSLASFRHFCTVTTGRPAAAAVLLTLTPASSAALMSARCVSVRVV